MTGASLLFDLDGTLVDTDPLHHAVFDEMLADRGGLSLDDYRTHIMGQSNPAIMSRLFPDREAEHDALADAKEAAFRARIGTGLTPTPGLAGLLDWAAAAGIPVAVVTNAPRENAVAMLAALGLTDRFATLVIGPECARAKPDPLPYRTAMRHLGALPSRSLAFEDSRSGVRAASGSGAYAFGIRTALDDHALRQAGADATLKDFTDPVLWQKLERDFTPA